jgi:hypothetical protein
MTMCKTSLIHSTLARSFMLGGGLAAALLPALAGSAAAQGTTYGQPSTYGEPSSYGQPSAYGQPSTYDYRNPPPEPAEPYNRDNRDNTQVYVAPNQTYTPSPNYAADDANWARDNCVKARGNTAGGAVVGGILGAIVGSAMGGRHDHGTGTAVGAALGALGGAAVANSAGGQTSPGCPPGYVVRESTTYVPAPRQPAYYPTPAPYVGSVWYGSRSYWRPAPPRPVYGGGWGRPYGGNGHGWGGGHHRR